MAIVVSVVATVVSVVVTVVSVVVSSEVVASGEVPPPGASDDVVGSGVAPGVTVADESGDSVELRHPAALSFLLQSGPVPLPSPATFGEDRKQHIMKMFSKHLIIFGFLSQTNAMKCSSPAAKA